MWSRWFFRYSCTFILVLDPGHLRQVDGGVLAHGRDLVLEVGVDDLARLLVQEGRQAAQSQAQPLEIVQGDAFPEGALLHRGQVGELIRHRGNRALFFEQHGDLHHPPAVPLECARVALGEGQLHLQGREIEQARLDVVGLDLAGQAGNLALQDIDVGRGELLP